MTIRRSIFVALLATLYRGDIVAAQNWRATAANLGTSARVLIIGARPEDEDNALIAWLSLGHNIETAYLSLTRGESANNLAGTERQSALGVVRTAELLAERQRDGAHQYFSRAYDFGPTRSDSIVDAAWPHDSLLSDVVSIVRAFRPHVIISLIADSTDRDATRRMTARVAREAYAASPLPDAATRRRINWNSQWSPSRLFALVRDDASADNVTRIDVGEFDRSWGKSYAEIGAEIRRLQRTQPPPGAPTMGKLFRALRLDSSRVKSGAGLFDGVDTSWQRFRGALSDTVYTQVDSLQTALAGVRRLAASGATGDSIADALARVVKRVADVRAAFSCTSSTVPRCTGVLGDLAVSAERIRVLATDALLGAAGIVLDGTVDRELVAAGDSVRATATIYNGGTRPIGLRRLAVDSRTSLSVLVRDSTIIAADSVARWPTSVLVRATDLHWWQVKGLIGGTYFHAIPSNAAQIVSGEDRIATNGVEATIVVAGVDIAVLHRPLVQRDPAMVRGDDRHPLTGVTALSVLLERTAEYERAGIPIDRLFRVFLSSPKTTPETVTVSLRVPPGMRVDSSSKVATVPALGTRNVFFRLRGVARPGSDSVFASASLGATAPASGPPTVSANARPMQEFDLRAFTYGSITHEYPHIPSQQFIRSSKERVEAVDLKVPARLRVGYIKGTDDVQTALGQLQIDVHALDASLVSVVDLSFYSTILIGAGAMANDALATGIPSLREFMSKGGTVVVMAGGPEVARSGLLPFPITFDSEPRIVHDPSAPVRIAEPTAQILSWPNTIKAPDFDNWSVERARNVPAAFDQRYRSLLTTGDPGEPATAAPLLVAPFGKGTLVFSSLSVDRELNATHAGAARLFVNLLSAGLRSGAPK
jgi:LmbE family N-acetylglucosaminyl deacetylase